MLHRPLAASAALLVTATIGLAGCSSDSAADATGASSQGPGATVTVPDSPERVDAVRFAEVVSAPGAQIIDVRTPEEFAEGHLEGAVNMNVQGADFAAQISSLDPAGLYAVYCRSGNRSQAAVAAMADGGLSGIFELETGIVGWQEAGLPVVQ
jgi:rhodanese-related sulfurtransferase